MPNFLYRGETYNFKIYDTFRQSRLLEHAVLTKVADSLCMIQKQVLSKNAKIYILMYLLSTGYFVAIFFI